MIRQSWLAARSLLRRPVVSLLGAAYANTPGSRTILNAYVTDPPSRERAFTLFAGEWSSEIPGYGLGHVTLFDDDRIRWIEQQCGGFRGKRILELGPLEGGHTYMMARAGAADIVSIEANRRAFLKCLIVQNVLKFNADFRLGDFRPYLANCTEAYDLLIASGVLYHMTDPVGLLRDAARVSRSIALWTHYYDAAMVDARPELRKKFGRSPRRETIGSRQLLLYRYQYRDALGWAGFCGGSAPTSYWLTRDGLLGVLGDFGFEVAIGDDARDHQNGPALLLFASRRAPG
jgi:SAM-dependent methyltransferase